MNITGVVAGNFLQLFLTHLLTIVRLYQAAMFVLHVDTFKARTIFALRSRTFKKPYGTFLKQ